MKNKLAFIILLAFSCRQDESIRPGGIHEPVLAGIINNDMVYYDFSPDINLDSLSVPQGEVNQNAVNVDLDRQGENDLRMEVSRTTTYDYRIAIQPLNTTLNKISISVGNIGCIRTCSSCNIKGCLGRLMRYNKLGIINSDSLWTPVSSYDSDGDSLYNSSYTYQHIDRDDTTSWQPIPDQYIGFRFVKDADTLYGWLRLSIVGKSHIVIHDCAYQVKR